MSETLASAMAMAKKKALAPMPLMRTFEVDQTEVPELKGLRPGDAIELSVMGTIKSIRDNGSAIVEISQVQSDEQEDSQENNNEEKGNQEAKVLNVQTQESHVIS